MARPGIMLYFDIRQPLKVLPDADKGRLFDAILEYGEHGTIPEFDGMLAMAWGFIQPKLDRDSAEYERTVTKRQYATFCRGLKRKGLPEVSFDDWVMMSDEERNQMVSHDTTCYPTTTGTSTAAVTVTPAATGTRTPSTTSKATVSSTVAAAATENPNGFAAATADEKKMKYFQGELGKGVVILSDEQVDGLLESLGLDAFDHYVSKLATFIIKNGASVKSHYETILKWWKEDSNVHR